VIFYWLIGHVGPAKTMLVSYIAPGFAVVYGATLLDEDITVGTIAGLALILLGSWLGAEGRLPGRARSGDEPSPAEVDPAAGAPATVGAQPEAAMRRSSGAAR
jgi:hypothetical protein